jgi:hypothetical protein
MDSDLSRCYSGPRVAINPMRRLPMCTVVAGFSHEVRSFKSTILSFANAPVFRS